MSSEVSKGPLLYALRWVSFLVEIWKVEISEVAEKDLLRLERSLGKKRVEKIMRKVLQVLQNPVANRHRIGKLRGSKKGLLKLREGKLRVIFRLKEEGKSVIILRLWFRESIYDKL